MMETITHLQYGVINNEETVMNTEQERQKRIRENQAHVDQHNAQIQSETPGYVRTTGPRRQYEGSVDSNGIITWTEL